MESQILIHRSKSPKTCKQWSAEAELLFPNNMQSQINWMSSELNKIGWDITLEMRKRPQMVAIRLTDDQANKLDALSYLPQESTPSC